MTRSIISFLAIVTILSACAPAMPSSSLPNLTQETPSLTPSLTPKPSRTPSPTSTLQPSTDLNQIPSPGVLSRWTETYPTKQVLLFYGAASNTQITSLFLFSGLNFDISPFLILYTDGQLIIPYYEKQLSQKEMSDVLVIFEQLGFYQINGTAPIDDKNPVYDFQNRNIPNIYGNTVKYIGVYGNKSNSIGYMEEWEDYLAQPVKEIVSYLDGFSTEDAKPYQPDRLLVGIQVQQEATTENEIVIPWPDDVTHPTGIEFEGVLYLDGAEATKLFNLWRDNPDTAFMYEGTKLWLHPRPIYPHECQVSSFSHPNWYPTERPRFFCEDP